MRMPRYEGGFRSPLRVALVTLALLVCAAPAGLAGGSLIELRESNEQEHVTRASMTLGGEPTAIVAVIHDVERWPQRFSEVRSVRVVSRNRTSAVLVIDARTLKRTVTVRVTRRAEHRLHVELLDGPVGVDSSGDLTVQSLGEDGTLSRVDVTLAMEPSVLALPGSTAILRRVRHVLLERNLTDLRRVFSDRLALSAP